MDGAGLQELSEEQMLETKGTGVNELPGDGVRGAELYGGQGNRGAELYGGQGSRGAELYGGSREGER